jgi:2-polyprenyl-3-methyl-5-hydroxy-6-metoxy-1,4-benzoquinol methylase
MNYREKLYSTYVSTHTAHLYGEATIEGIRKQFPVWKGYYGRFLPKDTAAKILDIGCGNGGFAWWLQQIGYKNSLGIDISQEQIGIAKELGINNVEYADLIGFLEGKQGYYDVVFARDVIEHFNKDEILGTLKLTLDSLNDGGVVIIQTPNGESLFSGRLRYGDFTHEMVFTRSSLNQVLRVSGFKDIEFYPTGPVPKGLKSTVRYILWKGIDAVLRLYMAVETGSFSGIFTQNIIAVGKK